MLSFTGEYTETVVPIISSIADSGIILLNESPRISGIEQLIADGRFTGGLYALYAAIFVTYQGMIIEL